VNQGSSQTGCMTLVCLYHAAQISHEGLNWVVSHTRQTTFTWSRRTDMCYCSK